MSYQYLSESAHFMCKLEQPNFAQSSQRSDKTYKPFRGDTRKKKIAVYMYVEWEKSEDIDILGMKGNVEFRNLRS